MIFSVITGTPSIVFGNNYRNNYHKVRSSYYSLITNLKNIIYINQSKMDKTLEQNIEILKNFI